MKLYLLTKYVESHEGNVALATLLVKKLLDGKPPGIFFNAAKQAEREIALATQAIFERERELTLRSAKYHLVPEGLSVADTLQYSFKSYLQKQALLYAYYGVGNCSHRASYSAIHIAKALKGTGVKVTLFSFNARDQYVVFLTDKHQTLIYDPLTNPEELYEQASYKKNILTVRFPKVPKNYRGTKLQLTVGDEQYDQLQVTLDKHHHETVDFGTLNSLLSDFAFLRSLAEIRNKRKVTKNALMYINAMRKESVQDKVLKVPVTAKADPAAYTYSVNITAPSESPSSTSLLGIADVCLFACKNGFSIKEWLTEEQEKTANELGISIY